MSKPNMTDKPMLPSKVYDILKWIVQIGLPAFGALYFAMSEIWGLPHAIEVVGTVTAVTTFLGVMLGISTYQYNHSDVKYDGTVIVDEEEVDGAPKLKYNLALNEVPENLRKLKEVTLKVQDLLKR